MAMPKAPILGYVSNVTTPTRVRIVAARGVFWIGVLLGAMSVVLFFLLAGRFVEHELGSGPLFSYPLQEWIDGLKNSPGYLILVFLILFGVFTPALILMGFAAPIRRGRAAPSVIAMIPLVGIILFVMVATALFLGSKVLDIFDRKDPDYGAAFSFVLLPIPVLIVLVLKDLCEFLLWIARNPIAEKPAVAFLPEKRRGG